MKFTSKGCSIGLIILAVIAVLLVAAAIIAKPKIQTLVHEQVLEFLRKEGLFVEYQTKYGPLDGAVSLIDIVIYDRDTKDKDKKALAKLDRLAISVGLIDLIQHRVLRTHISTKNATFIIYGDTATGNPTFENLNLAFDTRPGSMHIDSLTTRFQGVELRATGEVQINRDASQPTPALAKVAPKSLLDFSPILRLAPALDYRKATWPPRIEATVNGSRSPLRESTWDAVLRTESFPSKNVKLDFTGRVITRPNGNVTIEKAQLKHASGEANFAGAIAQDSDTLTISRLDSTLDWIALVRDHPALETLCKPLTVTQPAHFSASGGYHLVKPELSKLSFSFEKFAIQYLVTSEKPATEQKLVSVPEISAKGSLENGLLRVNPVSAFLAKGNATGEVTYTPFAQPPASPAWGANLKGEHLYLADLVPPKEGRPFIGYVNFSFTGQGADKPEALQGQGKFAITNGDFVHTRVFGPLLLFLHDKSKNPEKGKAQELQASFTIQNGILTTKDVALDISEAHVQLSGTIDLVKQNASFTGQAKLRGPIGLPIDLIGAGPLDNVKWDKKVGLGR